MLAFLSKFKFQAKFIGLQIFSGVFILTLALIGSIGLNQAIKQGQMIRQTNQTLNAFLSLKVSLFSISQMQAGTDVNFEKDLKIIQDFSGITKTEKSAIQTIVNQYFDSVGNPETKAQSYNLLVDALTTIQPVEQNISADLSLLENNKADSDSRYSYILMILTAIFIILEIVFGVLLSINIIPPLTALTEVIQRLSVGNTTSVSNSSQIVVLRARKDELGDISRSIGRLKAYFTKNAQVALQIAEGNLSVEVSAESEADRLGIAFSTMIKALKSTIHVVAENAIRLSASAKQLAGASQNTNEVTLQITKTIQQIAQGVTQQTENINRTASSVEQMDRAIDGVARGAQEQANAATKAATITTQISSAIQNAVNNVLAVQSEAGKAAETAQAGSIVVKDAIEGVRIIKQKVDASAQKVQEMGDRSTQIGVIAETISDIAAQTNLLALNAAIEAARAGEAGKGFAVVADEVRKLAERSSNATKEITGLIRAIQQTVQEAVTAMEEGSIAAETGVIYNNQAGESLKEILTVVETVRQQADQATKAAQIVAQGANELVSAVDSVSAVVEENTASTEQMAAESSEVTQAIENIAGISEQNSAAIEEVAASIENEVTVRIEEISSATKSLADMAEELQKLVIQFKLEKDKITN